MRTLSHGYSAGVFSFFAKIQITVQIKKQNKSNKITILDLSEHL